MLGNIGQAVMLISVPLSLLHCNHHFPSLCHLLTKLHAMPVGWGGEDICGVPFHADEQLILWRLAFRHYMTNSPSEYEPLKTYRMCLSFLKFEMSAILTNRLLRYPRRPSSFL